MVKGFTQRRMASVFSFLLVALALAAQIPSGYYTAAEGKSSAALKTQLSSIISAGAVDKGYDGLYTIYQTSDVLPNGNIWDMYSAKADGTASYYYSTSSTDRCGSYSKEGDCYNREHSFCDSWLGAASPQRSDAHHIVPTDGYVNNRRSSFPHGKVGSASWTSSNGSKLGSSDPSTGYSGTVFEPIDEFKGDFARMYFYVATRYESKIAGWVSNGSAGEILAGNSYPAFKQWFYTLMVQWSTQDPVSQKEIDRNNAIYALQKNRNPYIDHPELVDYVWGNKVGQAWSVNGATGPVLSSPASGAAVSFGKVLYQQSASTTLQIKGANLTGGLSFALSGTNASNFTLSTSSVTQAEAEAGYGLTIHFTANSIGAQSAVLTITGGGISATTVSLSASSADEFGALAATNVSSTGFSANWSSSAAASGYALNVYTMTSTGSSQATTLLEDDFSDASAWTASGYTTATELASNIRLGSSSKNGVITSGALDMSAGTSLLVRAKQYASDANGMLTVKVNSDSITSFKTTSSNQDFTVNIPAKTTGSTLTLSAAGGSGKRVYVDYVKLTTQTQTQTATSVSGYPQSVGNVLTSDVVSLTPATTYYYTVTPQGNSVGVSNAVQVTTLSATDVADQMENRISWVYSEEGVLLRNLPRGSTVTVLNLMGRKMSSLENVATEEMVPLDVKGIYILQVCSGNQTNSYKIMF